MAARSRRKIDTENVLKYFETELEPDDCFSDLSEEVSSSDEDFTNEIGEFSGLQDNVVMDNSNPERSQSREGAGVSDQEYEEDKRHDEERDSSSISEIEDVSLLQNYDIVLGHDSDSGDTCASDNSTLILEAGEKAQTGKENSRQNGKEQQAEALKDSCTLEEDVPDVVGCGDSDITDHSDEDSTNEDDSIIEESDDNSTEETTRRQSRGRSRGRGRTRGTQRGRLSQQQRGTRGQRRSVGRSRTGRASNTIPDCAISIETPDTGHTAGPDFTPFRDPGPHLPNHLAEQPSELELFGEFIDRDILQHIVDATNAYAEQKKTTKRLTYSRFKAHSLTTEEILRYFACLLLLSINSNRNYRQAWRSKSSQYLINLHRLMTRDRFEHIAAFFHVVTPEEEIENAQHPLKKILPLHLHIKKRCLDLYQPLQQLSVDERMVKSKARTKFRQYIRNKPTKWGYKYWVLADPTGYTIDFDLYYGASRQSRSSHGLAYDVVSSLIEPFVYQGYQLYCDNFYTSPALFSALLEDGITATGTLKSNRQGVPPEVISMKDALSKSSIPRGTGYYVRPPSSDIVYVAWKDSNSVVVLSTASPGHSNSTIRRRVKTNRGTEIQDVPIPIALANYNRFMGGVDKSDQFISYNRILRRTKRYWLTMFYHMLEIATTNACILNNWQRMVHDKKRLSHTQFRDNLVQEMIASYGKPAADKDDYTVRHGSTFLADRAQERSRCTLCGMKTSKYCPDCPYQPPLCQVQDRDCHAAWHTETNKKKRNMWIKGKKKQVPTVSILSSRKRGRPMGMKNIKKRRGQYKAY
jgi:hypothetical protein